MTTIWAILPAAGIGRRMGSNTPKQYLSLPQVSSAGDAGAEKAVISHTIERLLDVSVIEKLVVVLHPDDRQWPGLAMTDEQRITTCVGGDERYQSVLNGLEAISVEAQADDWVLVHDAVRPCVRSEDIERLIDTLAENSVGGLLGSSVNNTVKRVDSEGRVVATVDRSELWNALTPQMFRFGLLHEAIQDLVAKGETVTDESAAMERMGHAPKMVEGSRDNIKITHQDDLILAATILQSQSSCSKDEKGSWSQSSKMEKHC
jgi:2-C-methyl-D-erythritol 4-phosphate cytidylyltransferase